MSLPKVPLVDLSAQIASIRGEIDEALARVLASSSFILGAEVEAFEAEFAEFCGARYCVACGNGTDALSLALAALGIGAGDEVITVAHTFIATAEAITSVGARPVFVDVRPDTLLLDLDRVEEAITPRTRAVIAVHLYGHVVDMDPLLELGRRRGLRIVEDASQAHGASYRGKKAGTLGDVATFSFYPGKNLGAFGDAGAILTADANLARWLRMARNHGRTGKYEHEFEGRNSRMDALQGAVLRVKLRHLSGWNARRRSLAGRYDQVLARHGGPTPLRPPPDVESAYHLYVVRDLARDEMLARLRRSGVEAGVHYPVPLHLQPAYRHLGLSPGSLPVTEAAAREVLSLPLYPEMHDDVVDHVARTLLDRP